MSISLFGCSQARKWTKPTIAAAHTESDVDFEIRDLLLSKYLRPVLGIDVWSFTAGAKLWELGTDDWSGAPLADSNLVYGEVPSRMTQLFPSSNSVPRRIDEGEAVIVRITYLDDSWLGPSTNADTKLFRKTQNGFALLPGHTDVERLIHIMSAQENIVNPRLANLKSWNSTKNHRLTQRSTIIQPRHRSLVISRRQLLYTNRVVRPIRSRLKFAFISLAK